jgi:hypothetical protein
MFQFTQYDMLRVTATEGCSQRCKNPRCLRLFWDGNITQVGCPACLKKFGTNAQFLHHIQFDVPPPLIDRLSIER